MDDYAIAREGLPDVLEAIARALGGEEDTMTVCSCGAAGFHTCTAAERHRGRITRSGFIGTTRACPDCGRPQHYTGTEYGWAHDALVDTWHCADPRKDRA